ncbi:MAG TPA: prepilin-type N-terminal cleavage/methylation domain-containing protein [Chthoniobacteraceae bacterium]|jgi:prepilin-type N-terminal cleavage/methylation domain-containing protein/prepilin-type processing-associated H-X9-DG protein
MKKSGFTLIELLVVIAIIAILAGIALPVFNKVQERSRATNCASNLRQLGLGIQGYLNDNEDQMFADPASGGAAVTPWPRALNPRYVASWKVFRSPFDKVTPSRPDTETDAAGVPVSYGINSNVLGKNSSDFVAPSQLIVAAPTPAPGNSELTFIGTSAVPTPLMMPASPEPKGGTHSGRAQINALYADSHVASMTWRDFAMTANEEGGKRWFPKGAPEENQ